MYQVEKGSIESSIIHLQNLGLITNEHKQQGKPVTYEQYDDLLDYAINILRQLDQYQKDMNALFDEVKVR